MLSLYECCSIDMGLCCPFNVVYYSYYFFVNQKTAFEMRISDWSSDVCSSDLQRRRPSNGLRSDHIATAAPALPAPVRRQTARAGYSSSCRSRSEERGVGKEGVSTCRSRRWAEH